MADLYSFYNNELCPAVYAQLPSIFPEFGWKMVTNGYVATNSEFTKTTFGADARRVVCNLNYGFYIFGQSKKVTSWVSYLTNLDRPKGIDWVNAVKSLCQSTGLSLPGSEEMKKKDLSPIYEAFMKICRQELLKDHDALNELYLSFSLSSADLEKFDIGFFPGAINWDVAKQYKKPNQPLDLAYFEKVSHPVYEELKKTFSKEEINESHIFHDTRWLGRVIGSWRSSDNLITSFWARTYKNTDKGSKYLFLKGGTKSEPYLANLVSDTGRENLVIVEGIKDAIILMKNGIEAVAIGSTTLSKTQVEYLDKSFVEKVTLCFDYDEKENGEFPGLEGTMRSIEAMADQPTKVKVIMPEDMKQIQYEKMDPYDFIKDKGVQGFMELLDSKLDDYQVYFHHIKNTLDIDELLVKTKEYSTLVNQGGKLSEEMRAWFANELKMTTDAYNTLVALTDIKKIPVKLQKRIQSISETTKESYEQTLQSVLNEGCIALENMIGMKPAI